MRAKKLLRNACKLLKHVFSDKRLNTIACGIASFAAGLWTTAAYLGFAAAATEFAAPFAVPLACIVALPWALTAMVLLNLRERRFKASREGVEVGGSDRGERYMSPGMQYPSDPENP